MLANERRENILRLLKEKGFLSSSQLCSHLNVSPATIRNDLKVLNEQHLLLRTHGGAASLSHPVPEREAAASLPSPASPDSGSYLFHEREMKRSRQKQAIAARALSYIQDHQCILLDASTTTLSLAKKLSAFNKLLVVTNGIYNTLALKDIPNITVATIGGIVTKDAGSIEGTLGVDMLKHFHIDLAFISAYGFTLNEGLTDFNLYEVELKKEMMRYSNRTLALIDSSKFGSVSVASLLPTDAIDTILTDPEIDDDILNACRRRGVHIEVCPYED